MILAKNGITEYRIVISARADVATGHAARELNQYLEKITGAYLTIVRDTEDEKPKEIVLGQTNRAGAPCGCRLVNDGFILKTEGEKLFILGRNGRACHYGVYYFLEEVLGCRFYTHDVEKLPRLAVAEIPELDTVRVSPLEYRETYWREPELHPAFALKRGFNASLIARFGEELGGSVNAHSLCHTTFSFVSPNEFFDEHPEYFSMVNGKRIREETQVCMTNPEVLEITKRRLRERILANPDCKIFSVSQMDWYNPCECPECAKIDAEEGSHAGTLMRFVNACADSIAEEFPDVIIETLAYQYTRKPPKITKARPNVCVCLCSIECCFTHPLAECTEVCVPFKHLSDPDVTFQQDLEGWSHVCDRMMVWDYTTNYRFYPAPMINLHVLQPNIQYFLKNNVKLLFEQGNAQAVSGEFGELRAYLISKLMWEPEGDVNAWMEDFLTGYYGEAAAKPIRAYIDLLRDHVIRHEVHAGIYENPMDVIPNMMLPRMEALWQEAEAAATAETLPRVRRSHLQVKFIAQHRRTQADVDFVPAGEALMQEIVEFGIENVQEGVQRDFSFDQIRTGRLPDSVASFWNPLAVPRKDCK